MNQAAHPFRFAASGGRNSRHTRGRCRVFCNFWTRSMSAKICSALLCVGSCLHFAGSFNCTTSAFAHLRDDGVWP
ncbi:hypothetical protein BD309DRAFT_966956 [Dichomitus squalens]|nr:hypothetical protein BD309DRAFT_966956 [Dichomitus squalens]